MQAAMDPGAVSLGGRESVAWSKASTRAQAELEVWLSRVPLDTYKDCRNWLTYLGVRCGNPATLSKRASMCSMEAAE